MRKILYILIVATFFGCVDYLDFVPEKDTQTLASTFEKSADALKFFNACYQGVAHGGTTARVEIGNTTGLPSICGADEFVCGAYSRNQANLGHFIPALNIANGLQNTNAPIFGIWGDDATYKHANRYWAIRNCNTFIENVDNVYDWSDEEKAQFKAEVMAVKAFYYLELIMQYGPIVLMPENIASNATAVEMQMPRQHVDTCLNRVVKLFKEALPNLASIEQQQNSRKVIFTKEVAYAFIAKARVWQASPLFNGNNWYVNFKNRDGQALFNSSFDIDKWKVAAEAADQAVAFCESQGRQLKSGHSEEATPLLNVIRDLHDAPIPNFQNDKEYLLAIWMILDTDYYFRLPRADYNDKNNHNPIVLGNINPSMRMVELFYTENGLPINADRSWDYQGRYQMGREKSAYYQKVVNEYDNVLNLHLKREPRFYANVGADGCYWKLGEKDVLMVPYKGQFYGAQDNRIINNIPQNLTGYWAKKFCNRNYDGSKNNAPVLEPFPLMRLADLYLLQAEAWNEYQGPSEKVYQALNVVRRRAGIPDVEEAWQVYSSSPEKVSNQTGLRDIIHQERMIELAFEGQRFWDMRRWKTAHIEMNKPLKGWNVFGAEANTFYNDFEGPQEVYTANKFQAPRDYLWPIRDEEVIVANIVQNPGW